jgi:hypothetical protein
MNIYEPDLDVKVTLPFVDGSENMLTPTALDYKVTDESGADVVALTNIPVFTATDGQIVLTVDSASNTLASGIVRGFRSVELRITVGADLYWVREGYILEKYSPLELFVNSFQTYEESLLNARGVASLEGWEAATKEHRVSAMIEAFDYMQAFSYRINYTDDTDEELKVNQIDSTVWAAMDPFQQENFKKAQIVEANYLLGGNPIEKDIEDGLQSSTIGEVSQFYRPRPSLTLPLCRDALKYVGRYINWSMNITRV